MTLKTNHQVASQYFDTLKVRYRVAPRYFDIDAIWPRSIGAVRGKVWGEGGVSRGKAIGEWGVGRVEF